MNTAEAGSEFSTPIEVDSEDELFEEDTAKNAGSHEERSKELMPPPPERSFATRQEALNYVHAMSKEHGYELVLRKPQKNKDGVIYKNYLECKRHRKLANTRKLKPEERVRLKRTSVRLGCTMRVILAASDPAAPNGPYEIRHCGFLEHNHPPDDPMTLSGHRKRSRMGQIDEIISLHAAIGVPPKKTLALLKQQHPNALLLEQDITNVQRKEKIARLKAAGQNPESRSSSGGDSSTAQSSTAQS